MELRDLLRLSAPVATLESSMLAFPAEVYSNSISREAADLVVVVTLRSRRLANIRNNIIITRNKTTKCPKELTGTGREVCRARHAFWLAKIIASPLLGVTRT